MNEPKNDPKVSALEKEVTLLRRQTRELAQTVSNTNDRRPRKNAKTKMAKSTHELFQAYQQLVDAKISLLKTEITQLQQKNQFDESVFELYKKITVLEDSNSFELKSYALNSKEVKILRNIEKKLQNLNNNLENIVNKHFEKYLKDNKEFVQNLNKPGWLEAKFKNINIDAVKKMAVFITLPLQEKVFNEIVHLENPQSPEMATLIEQAQTLTKSLNTLENIDIDWLQKNKINDVIKKISILPSENAQALYEKLSDIRIKILGAAIKKLEKKSTPDGEIAFKIAAEIRKLKGTNFREHISSDIEDFSPSKNEAYHKIQAQIEPLEERSNKLIRKHHLSVDSLSKKSQETIVKERTPRKTTDGEAEKKEKIIKPLKSEDNSKDNAESNKLSIEEEKYNKAAQDFAAMTDTVLDKMYDKYEETRLNDEIKKAEKDALEEVTIKKPPATQEEINKINAQADKFVRKIDEKLTLLSTKITSKSTKALNHIINKINDSPELITLDDAEKFFVKASEKLAKLSEKKSMTNHDIKNANIIIENYQEILSIVRKQDTHHLSYVPEGHANFNKAAEKLAHNNPFININALEYTDNSPATILIENSIKFFGGLPTPDQPLPLENHIKTLIEKKIVTPEEILKNAKNTHPIVHQEVKILISDFLKYKMTSGTEKEKELYSRGGKNGQPMTEEEFIERLLTKRPIVFMGADDFYVLRNGERGHGGFQNLGTSHEKEPLVLRDYLSYDEMEISQFLSVVVPTNFINDGNRSNRGKLGKPGSYETKGVYIGAVGARHEIPGKMDYKYDMITLEQNIEANGYGENGDAEKAKAMAPMAKFYNMPISKIHGFPYFPSFAEMQEVMEKNPEQTNYRKHQTDDVYCNSSVYKKRMTLPIEGILMEANSQEKSGYLHTVGLGLGVWSGGMNGILGSLQLEIYAELLTQGNYDKISDIHFGHFPAEEVCKNKFTELFENNSTIQKKFSYSYLENKKLIDLSKNHNLREVASPINDPEKILIGIYAWDGNALAGGNEYFIGKLDASGDPAAACCSNISELQNPEINPNAYKADNIKFYGKQANVSAEIKQTPALASDAQQNSLENRKSAHTLDLEDNLFEGEYFVDDVEVKEEDKSEKLPDFEILKKSPFADPEPITATSKLGELETNEVLKEENNEADIEREKNIEKLKSALPELPKTPETQIKESVVSDNIDKDIQKELDALNNLDALNTQADALAQEFQAWIEALPANKIQETLVSEKKSSPVEGKAITSPPAMTEEDEKPSKTLDELMNALQPLDQSDFAKEEFDQEFDKIMVDYQKRDIIRPDIKESTKNNSEIPQSSTFLTNSPPPSLAKVQDSPTSPKSTFDVFYENRNSTEKDQWHEFTNFLYDTMAVENSDFLKEYEKFIETPSESMWNYIYEKYLSDNTASQLNNFGSLKKEIKAVEAVSGKNKIKYTDKDALEYIKKAANEAKKNLAGSYTFFQPIYAQRLQQESLLLAGERERFEFTKNTPIALLDVDDTLIRNANDINTDLIQALKAQNITQVLLFSTTTFSLIGSNAQGDLTRNKVIELLKENGIEVMATVITSTPYEEKFKPLGAFFNETYGALEKKASHLHQDSQLFKGDVLHKDIKNPTDKYKKRETDHQIHEQDAAIAETGKPPLDKGAMLRHVLSRLPEGANVMLFDDKGHITGHTVNEIAPEAAIRNIKIKGIEVTKWDKSKTEVQDQKFFENEIQQFKLGIPLQKAVNSIFMIDKKGKKIIDQNQLSKELNKLENIKPKIELLALAFVQIHKNTPLSSMAMDNIKILKNELLKISVNALINKEDIILEDIQNSELVNFKDPNAIKISASEKTGTYEAFTYLIEHEKEIRNITNYDKIPGKNTTYADNALSVLAMNDNKHISFLIGQHAEIYEKMSKIEREIEKLEHLKEPIPATVAQDTSQILLTISELQKNPHICKPERDYLEQQKVKVANVFKQQITYIDKKLEENVSPPTTKEIANAKSSEQKINIPRVEKIEPQPNSSHGMGKGG